MSQGIAATETDVVLDALTRRCSNSSKSSEVTISSEELSHLRVAFLPSQSPQTRAKSFVALSAFCQAVQTSRRLSGGPDDTAGEYLAKVFLSNVVEGLADTAEEDILASVSFLSALFQVDGESASSIIRHEGTITSLMDVIDLGHSDTVTLEIARTFAQACGHKLCRESLPDDVVQWLRSMALQTHKPALRAAATVALVKLSRGALSDAKPSEDPQPHDSEEDMELVSIMKGMTISGNKSVLSDAVEGLVYMSVEPTVKEMLSTDFTFWKQLFSYIPKHKSEATADTVPSSVLYGITMITLNVCAYRPRLTEEETQMLRLRRLASSEKMAESQENPLEDDNHVKARCKCLVQAGLVSALSAVVRATDSQGVRRAIGRVLLYLVEDKENRGKVLQEGGAKVLMSIIRTRMSETKKDKAAHVALDASDLQAIQALAKLAITSAPFQVFGPGEVVLYDAIRPMASLVLHSSSNLLQRFEGMMALTNLSSASAEVASRIAAADGVINKVELLLLEEHTLIRRAAMELLCNLLAGSDELYEKYSESRSKMQVVVALSDVEDVPTRLAASGALAQLTASPAACSKLLALQMERHRVLQILSQLIDAASDLIGEQRSDPAYPGLMHRGIVCIRNFLVSVGAETVKKLASDIATAQLPKALIAVAQQYRSTSNTAILVPTAEVLKLLLDCGINVSS